MGKNIELTAEDGHRLNAYRTNPDGPAKGSVVVLQEILGVNEQIRNFCENLAIEGFTAVAPALFDRVERGVELAYNDTNIPRGREMRERVDWEDAVRDVAAAVDVLRPDGKVGVMGYSWGASVAWLAACRLDLDAAVCYCGTQIITFKDEMPRCAVILHFGESDALIPLSVAEEIRAAHPDLPLYLYPGGHGFNFDDRETYNVESARQAGERTLAFLREHLV